MMIKKIMLLSILALLGMGLLSLYATPLMGVMGQALALCGWVNPL